MSLLSIENMKKILKIQEPQNSTTKKYIKRIIETKEAEEEIKEYTNPLSETHQEIEPRCYKGDEC